MWSLRTTRDVVNGENVVIGFYKLSRNLHVGDVVVRLFVESTFGLLQQLDDMPRYMFYLLLPSFSLLVNLFVQLVSS